MTVTSPAPGSPGRPARRRYAGALAVVGVIVALVTAVALPGASLTAAADASPTPTPTPTSSGETRFTLAPVGNGIVRPGEALTVSVSVRNETPLPVSASAVTLSLGGNAFPTRTALRAWLAGDTDGVTVAPVADIVLEAVEPDAEQSAAIAVPADHAALTGLAPGVYPLVATYDLPSGPLVSTSAMIVPDDASPAVGVGVLVPITAPPLTEGLLSADELEALTAPGGSLANQLDGVTGTSAILAIDPAIVAAIRVLGAAAPESALAWLERLEALPNARFALQYGDADVAAQVNAGIEPLAPTSLTAYMNVTDFPAPTPSPTPDGSPSPTASPEASPSPTDDPDAPVLPSLEELLDVGASRANVYWPATGTASAAVVDALTALGTEDDPALTVLSSADTAAGRGGGTVTAHAASGEAELLVYDADVSAALNAASSFYGTAGRGAPLTAATAYLAFAMAESAGASILVTLDRGADRSHTSMRAAINAAADAPRAAEASLPLLTAEPPRAAQLTDAEPDQARTDAASALTADENEIARFATILDEPSLLTGPQRAEVLQLLGNGWLPDPTSWQVALADNRERTRATLDAVGILPPSTIQLFAYGAGVPVWVRNELPYPVNVVLYASPDDLRLDVQEATQVTASAASNTRVEVPVQARVGSGEVTVDLQLRSRSFEQIGDPQSADVWVRAEWETVGTVALGIVVAALLGLGVVRTVLRARQRKADAATRGAGGEQAPREEGGAGS
ncbi:DUF6049 family protein [Microbacterium sp.]|uniref:DUF6049 family protein n=1 Tax=Microbacterium sp. TaxID=51671 RepID=UPI002D7663D6|nr:DUF6049 family protein [Microbacterium sp.]HET6301456.1 DUF6049 family protein [Microbacterium sp.]